MTLGEWVERVRAAIVWMPVAVIRSYQKAISPLLPPACRFHPTCSQYAIDALRGRGLLLGALLTLWRVVRCNPWSAGGHEPVPLGPRRLAPGGNAACCDAAHNPPNSGEPHPRLR